LKKSPHLK